MTLNAIKTRAMNNHGMTMTELVIAIVMIGTLTAVSVPRVGDALVKHNVRSARSAVVTMHSKARASAVQRGRQAVLRLAGGNLVIESPHPVTGIADTVGTVEDLSGRFGISLSSTRDSLVFDPRGLGTEAGSTTIVVQAGALADTIVISPVGRVLR
jgi:prepilin-type N-terminal cleavage/methylation domain-containing protein